MVFSDWSNIAFPQKHIETKSKYFNTSWIMKGQKNIEALAASLRKTFKIKTVESNEISIKHTKSYLRKLKYMQLKIFINIKLSSLWMNEMGKNVTVIPTKYNTW